MEKKYRIVIVDDEPWALVYLKRIFSRNDLGFEVIAAESGAESALRCIRETRPDVVITDVRIPRMTGLELLEYLREQQISCEVVIVSAFAEFSYAQTAMRYGAYDFCIKPVSMEEAEGLLKRLRNHLNEKNHLVRDEAASTGILSSQDSDYEFEKLLAYIRNNYAEKMLIKELAQQFSMSPNYCSSLFVKKTGMTFSQYITKLRMEKAEELLKNPQLSIHEISEMTGYEDMIYFNKVFKKYFSETPSRYRAGEKNE